VFTLDEALAVGWTPDALRHAVSKGRLVRIRPGVFGAPQPKPDRAFDRRRQQLKIAALAAALANPASVVSHGSAAAIHALSMWRHSEMPCVTVPPHFVGDIERAHLHRAQLPSSHLTEFAGVPVTDVARTIIDVGREDGALSGVVAADSALHRGMVQLTTLWDHVRDCRGWPGIRAARRAIEFADGRSESALESASRFKLDGLVPTPELQMSIYDLNGNFAGRADFLWPEFGVVGEADGLEKYDDDFERTSLRKEKLRQEAFERLGLTVVRWGNQDLAAIEALVERLSNAYERGTRQAGPRNWVALPQGPAFAPFSGVNRAG
jgi:predicted transcriptional regulator of viral defense system